MRKISSLALKICSYQARLFEQSLTLECSSGIFIRRFMNSELAKRMDNVGFAFDSTNVTDDLKELENQYGASKYGTIKFTREELYWIGYLYRYWAYVSDKSSKQVYKLVKPEQLKSLYFPYHSLDPLQAIERILEATSLEPQNQLDDIARGVSILRKVRSRTKAPRFTDQ